jgi:aryl-alcohol dehydrogenase-like predicted oxidoreductase
MEYRVLGRSELRVSTIALGGATFGREIDERAAIAVLDHALERGITLYDTAEAYSAGRSEEILGRWIASRGVRNRIVLATKVTVPLGGARVIASAEDSLRRLHVDSIDLFQLHNWDSTTPLEETLEALDTLVCSGKVRYIGCSNFAAWQLCKALWRQEVRGWASLVSVQQVHNLAMREIEQELIPLCEDQQIGVITYSPVGAGFLAGEFRQGGPVPRGSRFDIVPAFQDIYFNDASFGAIERLRVTATKMGLPMAQLALAWALSRPGITTTLIGACGVDQIDQAFDADAIAITDELQAEIVT